MLPVLAIPVFCVATWVSALNDPSSGKNNLTPPLADARFPPSHRSARSEQHYAPYAIMHHPLDEFRLRREPSRSRSMSRRRSRSLREERGEIGVTLAMFFLRLFRTRSAYLTAHPLSFSPPFLPAPLSFDLSLSRVFPLRGNFTIAAFTIAVCLLRG